MTKILILGGTREAAELAADLVRQGHDVTTSLAGRTREPEPVAGQVRIGGFGGAEGLSKFLTENGFQKLVDATHPFASQISANAKRAAAQSGISLETHARPPWQKQEGDLWTVVPSIAEACAALPPGARVLLALGSQHITAFKTRDDVFFLVRMVDAPDEPLGLPDHDLVLGKPSRNWREERRLLQAHRITHVVSRNSGGTGAYGKIEAARAMQLPVIMIERPREET